MKKEEVGRTRNLVLEEWKRDPLRTIQEFADALGLSYGTVSGHLSALQREGKIKRPKLLRTYNHNKPGKASRDWNVSSKRVETFAAPKRKTKRTAKQIREQELIDRVVANAQKNGTAWTGGTIVKLSNLSGCKVG